MRKIPSCPLCGGPGTRYHGVPKRIRTPRKRYLECVKCKEIYFKG